MQIPFTGTTNMGVIPLIFTILISLIIAILVVNTMFRVRTFAGNLLILALATVIYLIISTSATPLGIALPPSVYPLAPNLGHEGVDLDIIGGNNV